MAESEKDRAAFPGQGGTRRGFVARNEIEDMQLFDEDPGKAPVPPLITTYLETAFRDVAFPADKEKILDSMNEREEKARAIFTYLRDIVRGLDRHRFQNRDELLGEVMVEIDRQSLHPL
jgi:hypothetical protein